MLPLGYLPMLHRAPNIQVFHPHGSQELERFLLKCFEKSPIQRPGAAVLLEDPWIQGNKRRGPGLPGEGIGHGPRYGPSAPNKPMQRPTPPNHTWLTPLARHLRINLQPNNLPNEEVDSGDEELEVLTTTLQEALIAGIRWPCQETLEMQGCNDGHTTWRLKHVSSGFNEAPFVNAYFLRLQI